ncbi:F-box protein CPR1-like [Actinidia eriantha]|uniref:F-box protein CPR1-like n=1 Tax=Actinidia eriantha TaxID=165200 RepID=UPI0025826519|nr:F-box protein CPR1-like [Actinidia eriantha]
MRENESSTPPYSLRPKEKEKQVCNRERKRENESSSIPPDGHFPCELIENILLRISVKNLLRYRCVSKSWHTLIDDHYFVKKHLEYNVKSNTGLGLIVKEDFDDNSILMVHLDDMVGHGQCDFVRVDIDNMDNIVGSCNGLICLSSYHLTIWNPSTGRAYDLPYNPTKISCRDPSIQESPEIETTAIFGFGHDSISADYKIMTMEVETRDNIFFCTGLWVYSLKTKSWTISSSPSFPSKQYRIIPRYGVFASNALHWNMARQEFNSIQYDQHLIGAFDLGGDNQFYEIQLPDCVNFSNVVNRLLNLGVLNECLCVCCDHPTVTAQIDIWVMKEYGVKESWIRLISFLPTGPDLNSTVKPLAYSRCGLKVLLLDCYSKYSKLLWYDLKTKNITTTLLLGQDWANACLAEVYMYSLIDPNNYK